MSFVTSRRRFTLGSAAAFAAVTVVPGLRVAAQDATATVEGEDQLEVFSWWTAGSEHAGLQELFNAFTRAVPNAEIIDAAVAGGAGGNALAALQTRLAGGDPPDSWQSHPGMELQENYVAPGYCEPITSLWEEEGWNDAIPAGLADQSTVDGEKYMIPVGVHRGNAAFFSRKVMADNGIEIGETMSLDDFFAAADTLKAAGIPALALGSKDAFSAPHVLECLLAATLGPDDYSGLWAGTTPWDADGVTRAIESFAKMLDYVNEDHPALTWDGAMEKILEGTAGFTIMGDWAYGNSVLAEKTDDTGYMAAPGSEASFIAVVDGFVLPKDAQHPMNANTWLRVVGGAEAQTIFSPFKGCIPARTDVDTSGFNDYQKWSAKDFSEKIVLASNAHGAAAGPQQKNAIFEAVVPFLVDRDVAMLQEALVMAAEDFGPAAE